MGRAPRGPGLPPAQGTCSQSPPSPLPTGCACCSWCAPPRPGSCGASSTPSCGTGASTGASRAPSAECPPHPGWQPGSSRGSRVSAGAGRAGTPPGPWTGPAPAPSHLLPGPGLLGSCQGLTGTWLGAHGLWVGLADAAGALAAAVGRAAAGWGALAGSMSTGWPRGPHQGRLMLSGSSPAPMLRISASPSPRMLALPLSSGVA